MADSFEAPAPALRTRALGPAPTGGSPSLRLRASPAYTGAEIHTECSSFPLLIFHHSTEEEWSSHKWTPDALELEARCKKERSISRKLNKAQHETYVPEEGEGVQTTGRKFQ